MHCETPNLPEHLLRTVARHAGQPDDDVRGRLAAEAAVRAVSEIKVNGDKVYRIRISDMLYFYVNEEMKKALTN